MRREYSHIMQVHPAVWRTVLVWWVEDVGGRKMMEVK